MNEKLSGELVDVIRSDEMSDLVAQLGDVAIATATDSDLLDSLPVLGTFRAIWRVGATVRDVLFLHQVKRLLTEIEKIPAQDRRNFTRRLDGENELHRFGVAVLLLIEKSDEVEKPAIIGRVLAAHMRGDITEYAKAMRLAWIVNRSHIPDLRTLKRFTPGVQADKAVADSLFSVGLLFSAGDDGGAFGDPTSGGSLYQMSDYATMLVSYGLRDDEG